MESGEPYSGNYYKDRRNMQVEPPSYYQHPSEKEEVYKEQARSKKGDLYQEQHLESRYDSHSGGHYTYE